MLLRWSTLLSALILVQGAVLDPSLFLSPGPPLLPSNDDPTPEERWNQSFENRVERDADLLVVPIEKKDNIATTIEPAVEKEEMEQADTFWLGSRSATYGLQPYPLSFSLTGTYGGIAPSVGSGVVANRYTLSNFMNGGYGRATLAGTGYGSYPLGAIGTRVYGGNTGASWSGWGNGKWGHYGKG